MTIEATSKENYYSKHSLLITSKAGTWELLSNTITEKTTQQPSLPFTKMAPMVGSKHLGSVSVIHIEVYMY